MDSLTITQKSRSTLHPPDNLAVFIETYGCQMNEYDSGVVKTILEGIGHQPTNDVKDADIILINTCAVREKAHEKVYNRLQSLAYLKKIKPRLIIGVLGCMAQNLGDDLFAQGLPVDFVMGPDNYKKLPDIIKQLHSGAVSSLNITQLSRIETYDDIQPGVVSGPLSFVTIMRGCDNFCSFCVVPYTRGRERSLSTQAVIDEINSLIDNHNVKEVTLLGQNVNSYQHENTKFTQLIENILSKTSIQRIRFTSPHPHDFPLELLELMASAERFCNQIHLPLQSGSTTVLKRMKRDYDQKQFLDLVDLIRQTVPGVGISSDIITGFCGESDLEFEDTLRVVQRSQFDMAYMFHYSERESTWAYKNMPDDVPQNTKIARLQKLIEVQNQISKDKNEALIGSSQTILVETFSKRSTDFMMGRSSAGKSVVFEIPLSCKEKPGNLIGQMLDLEITGSTSATLQGKAVENGLFL